MGQDLLALSAPVGALFMKTILFCRVSSKEQETEGYSLPAQRKLLSGYSDSNGFDVKKVFSISESASGGVQRKTFNEMLSYLVINDIKILVVEKTDRLTRNHKDAVAINEWVEKDSERQVHFVKENFILRKDSRSNEKFVWNIKVSVAEYYLDNLSEEVKKGQKEKLAQGWLPTRPPLGYKTVGEKGKRVHVADESSKHYALKMFELYDSGEYSVERLTASLYKDGLRSTFGKKIPHSRIHQYLKDPFYIGLNKWNGKTYPGSQVPLISKEIFDRVQQRLRNKNTPKYNTHNFLFKASIRCKYCGGLITWETQKGIIYGHCNHYRDCSQKLWSKEPEVEAQLVECFDAMRVKNTRLLEWVKKALRETHRHEADYYENALSEVNKREERIKSRLSKLYDDKVDGKVSESFYDMKFEEYTKERTETEDLRSKYNAKDNKYYELGSAIYDVSQRSKEIYQKADIVRKRALLSLVFKNMWLDEGKLSYEFTEPFRLLSEAVKATNSSKEAEKTLAKADIFEPGNLVVNSVFKGSSHVSHPDWLPRVDSNHQPADYM